MAKFWRDSVILSIVLFPAVLAAQVKSENVARTHAVSPQVHVADMRLFENRGSENLVEKADRQGEVRMTVNRSELLFPTGAATTPDDLLEKMVCSADAVVLASVKWPQPSLNRRQTWVFTEYLMSVRQIIKDNAAHPLQVGQDIVVARSGGQFRTTDGKPIRLDDLSFPPFRMGRYLVFMRYVPASGQYTTSDPRGAFQVWGPRMKSLVPDKVLFQLDRKYSPSTLSKIAKEASCGTTVR